MKVANAEIVAGICGFHTSVRAEGNDDFVVQLAIASDCEKVQALATEVGTVSALDELGGGHEGVILSAGRRHLKGCCAACVVPAGIFKAMQVAAAVALPADVNLALQIEMPT
ncbi:MAG: DUF6951 family protein [Chloroflexota bacterium]